MALIARSFLREPRLITVRKIVDQSFPFQQLRVIYLTTALDGVLRGCLVASELRFSDPYTARD